MTISPLSTSLYTSLLSPTQPAPAGTASAPTVDPSALALQEDAVLLSSTALGQPTATFPTYDAQGLLTAVGTASAASAQGAGSATDINANWAQVLKSNPSLAGLAVENQTEQDLISGL